MVTGSHQSALHVRSTSILGALLDVSYGCSGNRGLSHLEVLLVLSLSRPQIMILIQRSMEFIPHIFTHRHVLNNTFVSIVFCMGLLGNRHSLVNQVKGLR